MEELAELLKIQRMWPNLTTLPTKKDVWHALNHAHHPIKYGTHQQLHPIAAPSVFSAYIPGVKLIGIGENDKEILKKELFETSDITVVYHMMFTDQVTREPIVGRLGDFTRQSASYFAKTHEVHHEYGFLTLREDDFAGVKAKLHIAKQHPSSFYRPDKGMTILSFERKFRIEHCCDVPVEEVLETRQDVMRKTLTSYKCIQEQTQKLMQQHPALKTTRHATYTNIHVG
jgi:hypothetical protein